MALLILRLGGRKLLYALSHLFNLPSIRTLARNTTFTRIMPSLGMPLSAEIRFNVEEIFVSKLAHAHPGSKFDIRTGMSVMWDEISQEEVSCYFPHLDSVGGLCREHSHLVNTRLTSFDNALSMARALAEGTVHYGKEASVIALGSLDNRLRGAFPIMVSPTCKKETPEASVHILETVLGVWRMVGRCIYGEIWTFTSDGDANRRVIIYRLFLKHAVGPEHRLFKYIGYLPGLNLLVGDDDITGDFDWKHEIKRTHDSLIRTIVS